MVPLVIRKLASGAAGLFGVAVLAVWHFPVALPVHSAAAISPDFANRVGVAALAAEQPERAEALARQALRFNPLEVKNLGLLALAREKEGDLRSTGALMSLASAYSWRDEPVRRWLFTAAASTGAYREMILHADALARLTRGQDMFLSALYLGALTEQTAPFVADRLAANPPYRESFFTLSEQLDAERFDAFERFMALLPKYGSPPSDAELLPFVRRLIAEAEVQSAERVWFRGRVETNSAQVLRDRSFARLDVESTNVDPFGWVRPNDATPVELFVGSPDGASGETALNIRSSELGPLELFSQIVRLPHSAYDFTFERKIEEGHAAALAWRLVCIGDGRIFTPDETEVEDGGDWDRLTYHFETSSCGAYRLSAFLDNSSGASQSIWIKSPRMLPVMQRGS